MDTMPPLTHQDNLSEVWVDSTPDGNYALRILEAFRRRCDCRYIVSGLSPERAEIYNLMNEAQEQRAKELDAAIRLLQVGPPHPYD